MINSGSWIAAILIFVLPPILLVWLPIFIGSKNNGKWIAEAFILAALGTGAFIFWHTNQGLATTCAINASECAGATAFAIIIFAYCGLFLIAGAISAFFNVRKWRLAKLGAN